MRQELKKCWILTNYVKQTVYLKANMPENNIKTKSKFIRNSVRKTIPMLKKANNPVTVREVINKALRNRGILILKKK